MSDEHISDEQTLDFFFHDKPGPCSIIEPFARWVAHQIQFPGILEKWRVMVSECVKEYERQKAVNEAWRRRRYDHFCKALTTPAWKATWNDSEKPPEKGWVRDQERVRGQEEAAEQFLLAWVHPELHSNQEPIVFELPLPLSKHRELTIADRYAILAFIHDESVKGAEKIAPWSNETKDWRKGWYQGQCRKVAGLTANDQVTLDDCLARVVADTQIEPVQSAEVTGPIDNPIPPVEMDSPSRTPTQHSDGNEISATPGIGSEPPRCETNTEVDWNDLLLSPPLSAAGIAAKLGQPVEAVERTLRYFRTQHDYGFTTDDDAAFGESRYHYKMPEVLAHLQKWVRKRYKKSGPITEMKLSDARWP